MKKTVLAFLLLTACGETNNFYTIAAEPQSPTSLGCFLDAPMRALPAFLLQSGATVENCQLLAKAAGYKYSGVEYGIQCFAGDTLPTQAASNCNMPCVENQTETCGGSWAINVYPSGL